MSSFGRPRDRWPHARRAGGVSRAAVECAHRHDHAQGWPYVAPVWYELDLDARRFLVVGREHAVWVGHIRDNPRVAFHVADDAYAEHTRVFVQATAEILEGPVAPRVALRLLELTYRLSLRYLGPDGPSYADRTLYRPRVLVSLTPVHWTSWTGREWPPATADGRASASVF